MVILPLISAPAAGMAAMLAVPAALDTSVKVCPVVVNVPEVSVSTPVKLAPTDKLAPAALFKVMLLKFVTVLPAMLCATVPLKVMVPVPMAALPLLVQVRFTVQLKALSEKLEEALMVIFPNVVVEEPRLTTPTVFAITTGMGAVLKSVVPATDCVPEPLKVTVPLPEIAAVPLLVQLLAQLKLVVPILRDAAALFVKAPVKLRVPPPEKTTAPVLLYVPVTFRLNPAMATVTAFTVRLVATEVVAASVFVPLPVKDKLP